MEDGNGSDLHEVERTVMEKKIGNRGIKLDDMAAMYRAFDAANGRASTHTLGPKTAAYYAEQAEQRLEKAGVAKSRRVGCTAYVCGSGADSRSYKYPVTTTCFELRRFSEGWRLMSADRALASPQEPSSFNVSIPVQDIERIKRDAIGKALAGLSSLKLAA